MKRCRRIQGWVSAFALFTLFAAQGPPSDVAAQAARSLPELKIALLPIVDTLPFYVAEENGYFREEGVKAVAVPVSSALERDQLMQAGQIDAMLNELSGAAVFNRRTVQVKVLSVARAPEPGFPLFRIVAAPGSGLKEPGDLAAVPIGVAKNSIIEYVTDRLLASKGLKPGQILKKSVPAIPERYQLLMQGRLKAATLPDPLAKSAMEAGALALVDDSDYPRFSVSVLSFSVKAMNAMPVTVRCFLKAWDRAAERINRDPEAQRNLLLKKIRVPKNVRRTYRIPPFQRGRVPGPGQWTDVMDWMLGKGLLESPVPYDRSVTGAFLPQTR